MNQYIEPFKELFNPRHSLKYRMMRFCARLNFFKYFPEGHKKKSISKKDFKYLNCDSSPNVVLEELHSKGLSRRLPASDRLINELLEITNSNRFCARGSKVINSNKDYLIKLDNQDPLRPDVYNIYSLMNVHNNNDLVKDFIKHDLLPIASSYLGQEAYIHNTQIWISFSDDEDFKNPDYGFHYDIDDYRFLKYFMYLSDVDENSGPHEVIEETHKGNDLYKFFNRRLTSNSSFLKKNRITTICGRQGDSFFEDTFCYHRGKNPVRPRIIFGAVFCVNKYD